MAKKARELKRTGTVDRGGGRPGEKFTAWTEFTNPRIWSLQADSDPSTIYVNIQNNAERFTGYSGEPARRIWRAIYDETCFSFSDSVDGMCLLRAMMTT